MAKGEHQVRELLFFQPCDQPLQLFLRQLAGVCFEDRLHRLHQRHVKQHKRPHALLEQLRNTGEPLGQHPHAEAGVAHGEAEFHQLVHLPFHIFRGSSVVQDDERIGAFKQHAHHFEPVFDLVLLAGDDIQLRVSLGKTVQALVESKCQAVECDVIEPATEGAAELVHEELHFSQVG